VSVARTMRETFGVGLSDLGGALSWGEAHLLLQGAMSDTSTILGAELAGWAYPASLKDIVMLAGTLRDKDATRRAMPWSRDWRQEEVATPEEVAQAQAELEDGIVFSS
jgi:hypothetical protein